MCATRVCSCRIVSFLQSTFLSTGAFPDPDSSPGPEVAYAVGGVLLSFLQGLPDPPIPYHDFKAFIVSASLPNSPPLESPVTDGVDAPLGAGEGAHATADAATGPSTGESGKEAASVSVDECVSPRCKRFRHLFQELPLSHRQPSPALLPLLAPSALTLLCILPAPPYTFTHTHSHAFTPTGPC